MDVPEAGKHVKKSTSQKLEDQKKVIWFFFLLYFRCLEIGFFYLLMFVLLLKKQTNQKTLAFPDVHLYSHASLGM